MLEGGEHWNLAARQRKKKTVFQEEISMMAVDAHYETSMCPPHTSSLSPKPIC